MRIISMASEYAIIAMIYISQKEETSKDKQDVVTVDEICQRTGVSNYFLSKIMIHLSKADLIQSSRGRKGGYVLTRPSESITVLDVVEAIEGSLKVNHCVQGFHKCPAIDSCPSYSMWCEMQDSMESILKKYTLHSLAVCIHAVPEKNRFYDSLKKRFQTIEAQ